MITEDYVSFEIAKLLKEKGFDELCDKKYNGYKSIVPAGKMIELWQNSEFDADEECSAPTLQMAMKWLREVHNIHIVLSPNKQIGNLYGNIIFTNKNGELQPQPCSFFFATYEEAAEEAIKFCLENLI